MEKVNKLICVILLSFLLAACQSYKKVPYLQDVEAVNQANISKQYPPIMPNQ